MKKIINLLSILFILVLFSCSSVDDLSLNKNEDNTELQAPVSTSEEIKKDFENSDDNKNNLTIEEPNIVLNETEINNNTPHQDTLEDLINTIPEDFIEPLVRTLDIPDIDLDSSEKTDEKQKSDKSDISDDTIKLISNEINDSKNNTIDLSNSKPKVVEPEIKHEKSKVENLQVTEPKIEESVTPKITVIKDSEIESTITNNDSLKNNSAPQNEVLPDTNNLKQNESIITEKSNSPIEKVETSNLESVITSSENDKQNQNTEEIKSVNQDNKIVETPKTQETITPPVTSAGVTTEKPKQIIPEQNKTVESNKNEISNEKKADSIIQDYQQIPDEEISTQNETKDLQSINQPTRAVSLNIGETLVVEYPGSGWIYLGSEEENNNLESKGRKSGNNTTYTLTAVRPGTQIQHFYKTDSLSGKYIDDYIEVTVNDKKGKPSTIVYAPKYEEIVPKKPEKPALSSDKLTKPDVTIPEQASKVEVEAIKTGERSSIEYTPEDPNYTKKEDYTEKYEEPVKVKPGEDAPNITDLYNQAKSLFDEKNYSEALKVINTYLDFAVSGRDKGLFLKAQILESDGATKNIKEAIKTYKYLQDNYPASDYWDDANKRIIYLKRFYIEAR